MSAEGGHIITFCLSAKSITLNYPALSLTYEHNPEEIALRGFVCKQNVNSIDKCGLFG